MSNQNNGKSEQYYRAYLEEHSVSRRGLFRGLLRGAEQAAPARSYPRAAARPPYAAPEPLFDKRCDGCGDCKHACPEYVIDIIDNKAQLVVDYGACSLCDKCAQACPTGALDASNFEFDTSYRPNFDRCQNLIAGNCRICVDACPKQAISLDEDSCPNLNHQNCVGCGQCQQRCPFIGISADLAKPS